LTAAGKTGTYRSNGKWRTCANFKEDFVSDKLKIDIFYDYGCPYVYAAGIWMDRVQAEIGDQLDVTWRYYPLEQINPQEGPEWKLWEQPEDYKSRGLGAFHGAIAARNQGDDAFAKFHLALLKAKHEDGKEHSNRETLIAAAQTAGLDLIQFENDLNDRSLLAKIGPDWEEGHDVHGAFGTPTFVFADGSASYIKMRPAAPSEDAVTVFNEFIHIVQGRSYITEIKRPNKPAQ